MISKKLARELMRKFTGMIQQPKEDEDMQIRIDALAGRAGSEQHARAVVNDLCERLTFFPTVADIVQACLGTLDPVGSEAVRNRKECPFCEGSGFITVDGPYGTNAAYPCDHSGRPRNEGVKLTPAVESHYQAEARAIPAARAAFAEQARKNPRRFQLPQAIRDVIGGSL